MAHTTTHGSTRMVLLGGGGFVLGILVVAWTQPNGTTPLAQCTMGYMSGFLGAWAVFIALRALQGRLAWWFTIDCTCLPWHSPRKLIEISPLVVVVSAGILGTVALFAGGPVQYFAPCYATGFMLSSVGFAPRMTCEP